MSSPSVVRNGALPRPLLPCRTVQCQSHHISWPLVAQKKPESLDTGQRLIGRVLATRHQPNLAQRRELASACCRVCCIAEVTATATTSTSSSIVLRLNLILLSGVASGISARASIAQWQAATAVRKRFVGPVSGPVLELAHRIFARPLGFYCSAESVSAFEPGSAATGPVRLLRRFRPMGIFMPGSRMSVGWLRDLRRCELMSTTGVP